MRFLKGEVGRESFRVRAFAATERMMALAMVIDTVLTTLLASAGLPVSVLCWLTRRPGLKGKKETVYKLR